MNYRTVIVAAVLASASTLAAAQDNNMAGDHGGMGSQALMESNQEMMRAMQGMQMSGDVDKDFATMMIDHHQGAIDMARVQLEHGGDPEMRQMAEEIIAAQEKEIATFKEWLAKQGN
jgi:uncharacterized protein (DUF305 family)